MNTTKPRMLMITMTTTALAASGAAFAQAGFSLGPTFDYSSGKFGGTQSTDVTSVGVAARYERGPLSLRINVPYVRIDGPGNVVPSGDSRGTQIESESGNRRGRWVKETGSDPRDDAARQEFE